MRQSMSMLRIFRHFIDVDSLTAKRYDVPCFFGNPAKRDSRLKHKEITLRAKIKKCLHRHYNDKNQQKTVFIKLTFRYQFLGSSG